MKFPLTSVALARAASIILAAWAVGSLVMIFGRTPIYGNTDFKAFEWISAIGYALAAAYAWIFPDKLFPADPIESPLPPERIVQIILICGGAINLLNTLQSPLQAVLYSQQVISPPAKEVLAFIPCLLSLGLIVGSRQMSLWAVGENK